MTRILIASVVRQSPEVLRAALQTWKWQTGQFKCEFLFIDDNTEPESSQILAEAGTVWNAGPKPEGARYAVTQTTHDWSVPTFWWLAQEKQRFLSYARKEGFDAIWLIDSDLLCSPDTLSSLWNTRKECVSAVFWTKWNPDSPPLPQVWLSHPYELQGRGMEMHEFLGALEQRKLVQVTGLGACTLIRASAFDKVGFWPLVENLPNHGMWQGEDRHFCVTAARNHVQLWADAWPDVWHCYRPEDRANIVTRLNELSRGEIIRRGFGGPEPIPTTGDLVSITVEPLEEAQLPGYVHHERGRLGAIRMLPQIERQLQNMRAGEEAIIPLRYPLWWDIPEYRGQTKLVRVKLLHAKPFAEHPTLAEPAVHIPEAFMAVA